jgi:cytosine/creatinine deaminase
VGAGDLWLRDARVPDSAAATDIVVRDGRIDTVGLAPDGWEGPSLDARGHLVLPGLVDGHAHVDKTLWGLPWRPHSAGAGLAALIENERTGRRGLPPVSERAAALFETYSAQGTTLIRTHVDVDLDNGITAVEGVLEAAGRFRDHSTSRSWRSRRAAC